MARYLILKFEGVMQAWGKHTFEDYRPTEVFPTRSGIIGLIAACIGIDRKDGERQRALHESFRLAVRADSAPTGRRPVTITDYHTIQRARRVSGRAGENPVESRREYLCDAAFTVALEFAPNARFGLDAVADALRAPHYTPSLGRRSCPPGRPLVESVVEAGSLGEALALVPPHRGTVYSEDAEDSINELRVRDVPVFDRPRQFMTRRVWIHPEEAADVSDQTPA